MLEARLVIKIVGVWELLNNVRVSRGAVTVHVSIHVCEAGVADAANQFVAL